jgi:hypothetical protein
MLFHLQPTHNSKRKGAGLCHTPLRFTTNPNMIRKSLRHIGSALSMFGLLSLFEVVISKAIEQYVLHSLQNARAKLHKLSEITAGKDKNIKNSEKYGGKRYNVRE